MNASGGDSRGSPTDVASIGVADDVRARQVRAYDQARAAGDVDAMAAAALSLAAAQRFGTFPGRVPAFLFEAYSAARGAQRTRLAVAVARAWAYGGDPARAASLAAEALADAEQRDDPALLAEALDAQLLVHWGPDDLEERLRITAMLEDTVAHVTDAESRMSAHLWRLTTALENLDAPSVRRQLRALDVLAAETVTPRVRFFAASRRGMYALLTGDLGAAEQARSDAVAAGTEAGESDTYAIARELTAGIARQSADSVALAREAASFEAFGLSESVTSIAATGAILWAEAGDLARARSLLHQLAGADFSGIARDVDWLLSVTSLAEVAVAVGAEELAEKSRHLLEPYAGRAVVNGGGVAFAGVVDDFLGRACRLLGHDDESLWSSRAAAAYQRMGAPWWLGRVQGSGLPQQRPALVVHVRPGEEGVWWVGFEGAVTAVRDVKGLHYLRLLLERPGLDVAALELSDAVAGHPGAGLVEGGTGDLLDRQALESYRRRLADLDGELGEARSWADTGRVARLEDEKEALLGQLRAAVGLGSRQRSSGAAGERARVAVRKAIAGAIDRIQTTDPQVGRLLRDTVTTGAVCRYDPDPDRPARWVLTS